MIKDFTILLVDDHQMFRDGVRRRLEEQPGLKVVGEAGNGSDALRLIADLKPELVILDIRLPDTSGIDLARHLRKEYPDLKILILTGYDFEQYVKALARIGVNGYILKDAPLEKLAEAIMEVRKGGGALSPAIASTLLSGYADTRPSFGPPYTELTLREIEVLELMQEGFKNLDVAAHLGISFRTVETHVTSIILKLGARNRSDAIRIASRTGLIR